MSRIFKTTSEDIAIEMQNFRGKLSSVDVALIKQMPSEMNDDALVEEREKIEKCAANNSKYFYNKAWNKEAISQIKEYACVCKCEVCEVDKEDESFMEKTREIESMTKSASTVVEKQPNQLDGLFDPFHLNEDAKEDRFAKNRSWEVLTAESKTSRPSVFSKEHSIVGLGGGEDYNKNMHMRIRKGQNSVTAPNAIESEVESKDVDVGVRLRNDRKEMESRRSAEIVASEKKIAQDANESGFGASRKGNVTLTEAMNAQPGIQSKDPFKLEDRVASLGEKLAEQNATRKDSIQRKSEKDRSWDTPQTQAIPTISDAFAESIKAILQKIKK
jgi:hypothetical protein